MNSDSRHILDMKHYEVKPENEVRELFRSYHTGDADARTQIIEANLRLVVFVAKRYHRTFREIDIEDMIQVGNLGLLKAVERFDLDRETKFATYAHFWIKAFIQRHVTDYKKHTTVSIDSAIDDDGLEFKFVDDGCNGDHEAFENVDFANGLLPVLNDFEYVLVCNVYGLHNLKAQSFRDLQHVFGCTYQRLQQIASEAINKMRRYARLIHSA